MSSQPGIRRHDHLEAPFCSYCMGRSAPSHASARPASKQTRKNKGDGSMVRRAPAKSNKLSVSNSCATRASPAIFNDRFAPQPAVRSIRHRVFVIGGNRLLQQNPPRSGHSVHLRAATLPGVVQSSSASNSIGRLSPPPRKEWMAQARTQIRTIAVRSSFYASVRPVVPSRG
jgi:hypothetical protein